MLACVLPAALDLLKEVVAVVFVSHHASLGRLP
jgi:hypothetical protein